MKNIIDNHTCFFLAYLGSSNVASDAVKFPIRTFGRFFSNGSVVTVSTSIRIPPFRYSQRFTIDPSPVTNCSVPKQPYVPLIFCCCPILELIRDKLPLSLCFHGHEIFLVIFTRIPCLRHVIDLPLSKV